MKPEMDKNKRDAFVGDFVMFTLLSVMGEFFSRKGLDFFSSDFSFSVAALPLLILFYRWGLKGFPSLFIWGFFSSLLVEGASYETYLINVLGAGGLGLGLLLFLKPGREEVKLSLHFAFLYVFLGFTGIVVLRGLLLSKFESHFFSNVFLIASNEALSFIASSLLFILMRKKKEYLIYLPVIYQDAESLES